MRNGCASTTLPTLDENLDVKKMKRRMIAPALAEAARKRQAAFFARTGAEEPLRALFDHLPDHRFFIKSKCGHFLAANPYHLSRLGLAEETAMIGSTDEQVHPPAVARVFRQDDLRIMRTTRPLINHVEMLFHDERNRWEWGCTTKMAMRADDGRVIGVIGISYPAVPPAGTMDEEMEMLQKVVAEIHGKHRQALKVDALASEAGLSARRLNQLFQQAYRMNTQKFIIHTRVQAAVQTLLHTRMPLGEVALEHGFSDQSAFTRHFRRLIGQTPQEFRSIRRSHREAPTADFIQKTPNAVKKTVTGGTLD
jgi:AraC-like DNA-binding protein